MVIFTSSTRSGNDGAGGLDPSSVLAVVVMLVVAVEVIGMVE